MTAPKVAADTAFRAADYLRVPEPWEVFGERSQRYEIHLNGRSIELVRGPILLEGFGVRVFRRRDAGLASGFQASTDLSAEGVKAAATDAEALSEHSSFPAKKIELPGSGPSGENGLEVCDPRLWERPMETLNEYVDAALGPFDTIRGAQPSFGSVRATLTETTLTNSAGLKASYARTLVWFELAVKAQGGPEGAPPGEYWVNETMSRVEPSRVEAQVPDWCRYAEDVRRAVPPPTGELPVVLPTSILSTIVPSVLGTRFTGRARLREVAPGIGEAWGNESVTVHDDGRVPWGVGSSPVDDEGTPQRRRTLLDHGKVKELLYDVRHAGVFGTESTGSGIRGREFVYLDWRRFLHPPQVTSTTLVVEPGTGGSDAELVEAAGEGLWVQQLGWAIPDPLSGAFGGEIRIGYRIRGGKLAEPVRGGTVGGVVLSPPGTPSLLGNIAAIGSAPALAEGILSPTLLVRPLTVAGK